MAKTHYSFFFLPFVASLLGFSLLGKVKIETSFDPPTITSANQSTYKVVVHGTQKNPIGSVPSVDGLNFSTPPRTLRSASFINGVPSVRFELSFTVTPERQGTFTVPNWNIKVDNESYIAPKAQLMVLPPNQKDKLRLEQERQQQANLKQAAFLEFICPRPFLFEGETVAAEISLFLWDRLPVTRIDQVPQKKGTGFSMTELGQPTEQRNVNRFNKNYSVYTWNFGLTGTMLGKHSIAFDSVIRVRVQNNRSSPFSNPFFNDPFFGFGREEGLQIKSDAIDLEIRKLPLDKRPQDFQGAIGNLSVSTSPDKNRITVGDPIRLTYKISGTGNFSAMPAPKLFLGDNFKVGPPAFSFEGNENTKHSGTQSFEYIVTPLKAGLIDIPKVSFSFFNPEEEKYYTLKTNSHSLRVDPGEKWITPDRANSYKDPEPTRISTQDLFQSEPEPGKWITELSTSDLSKSKKFWLLQSLFLVALIVVVILRLKRQNPLEISLAKKDKALDLKARSALKHNDESGLYQAIRRRIRLRVGIVCNHTNSSALSSDEVFKILKKEGFHAEIIDEVVEILKICDESDYAGTKETGSNLDSILQRSLLVLKKIK